MTRFSWILSILIVAAPLTMTNHAMGATKPGAARPAASRPAPARTGSSHAAPARSANAHPGAAHVAPTHARPAVNSHANSAKSAQSQSHAQSHTQNHGQANAGKNGMQNHAQTNNGKNGSQTNGRKNGNGQSRDFPGRGYRGFSSSNWLADFGVNAYYNPDDTTWYYWYEPSELYLPIGFINDYPPARQTVNNTVEPNTTSPLDGSLLPR